MQTCAQRAALVSDLEYVYVSNEYTLHGGVDSMQGTHPCPQFVNVVTLRWVTPLLLAGALVWGVLGPCTKSVRRDGAMWVRGMCACAVDASTHPTQQLADVTHWRDHILANGPDLTRSPNATHVHDVCTVHGWAVHKP